MAKLYASAASAAFYLVALAVQLSGWTSALWAGVLAAIATVLLLFAAWGYREKVRGFLRGWRLRVPWERAGTPTHPAAPNRASAGLNIIPITTFLRNSESIGWKFVEPKGYALDFLKLLREAAADGLPTIYGVRVEHGTQAELDGPHVKIPPKHWHEFQIDALSCFHVDPAHGLVDRVTADNFRTRSYLLTHKTGYVDLHVLTSEAEQWLRESIVPLKEAATRAYERTRGRFSATAAESSSGSPLTWYCYAIWQRIPIYGSYPASRLLEEIPDTLKNQFGFRIEGDQLVLREHSGKGRYENLHVRGHVLPEAISSIVAIG